jgi:hypothetical protein
MHLYHFIMNWKHTNSSFAFIMLSLHLIIPEAFLFWQSPIHILWVNCFLCFLGMYMSSLVKLHAIVYSPIEQLLQLGGKRQTFFFWRRSIDDPSRWRLSPPSSGTVPQLLVDLITCFLLYICTLHINKLVTLSVRPCRSRNSSQFPAIKD